MPDYICPKCFKKFDRKSNYARHINKIKNCAKNTMHYANLQSPENLCRFIKNYFPENFQPKKEEKKFICEYCNKGFSNISYYRKHMEELCVKHIEFEQDIIRYKMRKIDKIKMENTMLKEKIYEVLKTLPRYCVEDGQVINVEKDYIEYYQQRNIQPFGEEVLDHLTDSFMKKMIMNPEVGLVNLVRIIHFNNALPQNRNIFIKARRFNFIEMYRKKGWATLQRKDAFQNIIATKKDIMDEWFELLCERDLLKEKFVSKYENFSHGLDRYINHLVFNTEFNGSLKVPKLSYEKMTKMINLLFLNNKKIEITYTPEESIMEENPKKKGDIDFQIYDDYIEIEEISNNDPDDYNIKKVD